MKRGNTNEAHSISLVSLGLCPALFPEGGAWDPHEKKCSAGLLAWRTSSGTHVECDRYKTHKKICLQTADRVHLSLTCARGKTFLSPACLNIYSGIIYLGKPCQLYPKTVTVMFKNICISKQ